MSLVHAHHFVVDLETESTAPNAGITAIGIVYLHVPAGPLSAPVLLEFYVRTDHAGTGHVDPGTLGWWEQQSPEARAEVDGSLPRTLIGDALAQVERFMTSLVPRKGDRLVWGNGSSFDNVILREAFSTHGQKAPWEFWNDRDLRTLLAVFPSAKGAAFEGIKHHALHDARHEAKALLAGLTALNRLEANAEEETTA
ncbi:3' exoribonuclease, RNase T-like [compost metagenome]